MSEYQCYEFCAIDQPLTKKQQNELSELMHRAEITARVAKFEFYHGDFKGNPKELMETYFDAMMYIADWGSRQLLFRVPIELIDMEKMSYYKPSETCNWWKSTDNKHLLIDINFFEEGGYYEPTIHLKISDVVKLRRELTVGDFRLLYLAWLKSAEYREELEDGEEIPLIEPPVPAGLKQLSDAQKKVVRFFEMDWFLRKAAAAKSEPLSGNGIGIESGIPKLSDTEKNEFLTRLIKGDASVRISLEKRLHMLHKSNQAPSETMQKRRSFSSLKARAKKLYIEYEEKERIQEEAEKREKLEAINAKKDILWEEAYALIELKRASAYDAALCILHDLCKLAHHQGRLSEFRERIREIEARNRSRSGLLSRLYKLDMYDED